MNHTKSFIPKSLDGVNYRKQKIESPKKRPVVVRLMNDIVKLPVPKLKPKVQGKPRLVSLKVQERPHFIVPEKKNFWRVNWTAVAVSLSLFLVVFSAGAYSAWSTDKSLAEEPEPAPQILGESSLKVYDEPLGQVAEVPNEVFFSMTLEQLEAYLAEALKTPEMVEAEKLAERKIKLKTYLAEKRSPLVEIVDTIAELKHWKLVLAISNSESSLGKRCYTNNCSGIGVEPGHPYWREYETKADWAKDLDKLIERRYKDWTLDEMNGVYNYPGSSNWLMASKQILEEMQKRGIE
jgi:hypothetical protein